MKSIFASSFMPQRNYWMGQAPAPVTPEGLQYALDIYNKAQAWLAKTPNPSAWLGPDYPRFQSTNTEAQGLYGDVSALGEILITGGTLSDDDTAKANKFADDAGIIWGIISMHPVSQAAAAGTPQTSTTDAIKQAAQAAAQALKPGAKPAVKPAVPPPAPASDITTPLLVGGGVVAAIVIALVATR